MRSVGKAALGTGSFSSLINNLDMTERGNYLLCKKCFPTYVAVRSVGKTLLGTGRSVALVYGFGMNMVIPSDSYLIFCCFPLLLLLTACEDYDTQNLV